MIEPEEYDWEHITKNFNIFKRKIIVERMKRAKNGQWTVKVSLEIEIILPDGRVISAWPDLAFRARQCGKKPNPKEFGKRGKDEQR